MPCSTPPARTLPAACWSACAAADWRDHDAARRGVAYLLQAQEKDGSWYGRWGVNYVYGSFLAMRGLAASAAGRPRRR